MTALADLLRKRIAAHGPMSIADYMAECLLHPKHGYYVTRDPLGVKGDFTTAPEISQMFGELIGLSLAQAWLDQGSPNPFALVELGPGRGTLMADILRATQSVAGFVDAAQVHFVEASPVLRAAQAKSVPSAIWHNTIDQLPALPVFLVANEFFDALPVRQFTREADGWSEHVVGLIDDTLTIGRADAAPIALLTHRLADTTDGDIVEICPALPSIVSEISTRIAENGGIAALIDYGDWTSLGNTLQALADHKAVDPLAAPGTADLTTHVDFAEVARAVTDGARFSRLTTQGVFLERLGITARAQQLAAGLTGAPLNDLIAAHRRLTHPDEMGRLFKVIAIYPVALAPPAGLEP